MPKALYISERIFTVRDLVARLKKCHQDLPIRLLDTRDGKFDTLPIEDVHFFENMDTGEGEKEGHMVICYQNYDDGQQRSKTRQLPDESDKDPGELNESKGSQYRIGF